MPWGWAILLRATAKAVDYLSIKAINSHALGSLNFAESS